MKFKEREKAFRICPRCGLKSLVLQDECPDCGLVFARLDIATNKDAKKLIHRRETDYVIKTSKLPKDVSYLKLLLLTIFTGVAGGHCFRVGRYWRGALLLINFLAIVMYVVFNAQLMAVDGGALLASLTTFSGIIEMVWMYDIIMVAMKKFKVPVAIDLEGNLENVVDEVKQ